MADQKQPRFRVGDEQHATIRNRTWELFGFGSYYAWLLAIIVGGCFFPAGSPVQWTDSVRLGLPIGLAAGYTILFLLRHQQLVCDVTKPKIVLAGLLASMGTALVAFPIQGQASLPIVAIASFLAGVGNAYMMMAGNMFWSMNRSEMAMMQLSASMVSAFAAFYLLSFMPSFICVPLVCVLPLCCGLILFFSKGYRPRQDDVEVGKNLFSGALELRFAICVFMLAIVFGCILALVTFSRDITVVVGQMRLMFIAPSCAVIAALLVALMVIPSRFLKLTNRIASFLIILGAFLSLEIDGNVTIGTAGLMVMLGGCFLYDEFLWLLHSELTFRTGLPAAEIIPRFEMIEWIGLALGGALLLVIRGDSGVSVPDPTIILLCCGVLALVTVTLVFGPNDVSHILKVRERYESRPGLAERCKMVAERYGLSPRELEVLTLLARGRSATYIQDEFCIAQGTVKVHIRHIYEKTGVGGKQELINLVDTIEDIAENTDED